MAKFIPGPLISAISGRVGQSIFTSYKGVGVVKQAATSIYNPNSPAQTDARVSASYVSQQWATLTDEEQATWEEDARREELTVRDNEIGCKGSIFKGHPGPASGFNMFLMRNLLRYTAGIAPYTSLLKSAPLGISRPEGLATTSAVVVANTITFSWTLISNFPTTNRLKLWIKSTDAKIYVQLAGTAPTFPAGSIIISTVKATSGIPISIPPGKYTLQAQVVDINGKTSTDSEQLTVRVGPDNFTPTYFTPRQNILSLVGVAVDVPWTTLLLAGLVPPNTNSILVFAIQELVFLGNDGLGTKLSLRKDSIQGECMSSMFAAAPPGNKYIADNAIIPLTAGLTFDYAFTGIHAGDTYFVNIYMIAYIS